MRPRVPPGSFGGEQQNGAGLSIEAVRRLVRPVPRVGLPRVFLGTQMGLDTVELVMAVEEEFEIYLPNAALEQVVTVGDLFALVRLHLDARAANSPADEIWQRLVEVIVQETGFGRGKIVPDATLVGDLRLD